MSKTDTFDPVTGYLAMHMDMINDADSVIGVRLNAQYAQGYAQALYDIQRIRPETLVHHREEIERLKTSRLDVVAAGEKTGEEVFLNLMENAGTGKGKSFLPEVAHRVPQATMDAILGSVSTSVILKLDPNNPECYGSFNPGIEALKKLEGRQVAMLDQQELELVREFMDHGRKQGVLVEFDTDTNVQGWADMNSVRALEILAAANSYVRLRFS